jgi:hypothetical protein
MSAWYDPRTWVLNLFPSAPPGGWLVRDGHELRWPRGERVSVTCDPGLHTSWWIKVGTALHELEVYVDRPLFLGPVELIADLAAIWRDPQRRRGLTGCINFQQADDVPVTHAHSDIDYDTRDGTLRSVLITLPSSVPAWGHELVLHELAHALGLDHGDGVMMPVLHAETPYALSDADGRRLRGAYGR